MRKSLVVLFALVLVVAVAGLATAATPANTTTPAKAAPAQHGHQFVGTIGAFDDAAKTLTIKDSKGKDHQFVLTTATVVTGTEKVGEHAVVRYMVKDGKNVVTSIKIGAPAPAAAKLAPPKAQAPAKS